MADQMTSHGETTEFEFLLPDGPTPPAPAPPPSFSIVIPAYNATETVGEAVRSALAQTVPAEIVVVDDGSTDDLRGALAVFGTASRRVTKANGGGASARNAGVAAAAGEFVCFLDADDVYDPRRIEAFAALASARPELDILTTDSQIVVDRTPVALFSTGTPFERHDQRAAIMERCFVGGWPAIRRTRLLAIGGFDESLRIAYDWDSVLRLMLTGSAVGCVRAPLHEYRQGTATLTSDRSATMWERVHMLERARRLDLTDADRRLLRRALRLHRMNAASAEVSAVRGGSASRTRLARAALSAHAGIRPRAALALALVAPGLAARRLPEERGALNTRDWRT
jgi:glycosyltransferase involved in cell wall biosynthesis